LRQARGCNADAPYPIYELDGEPIMRCPLKLIKPETYTYLRFYGHYKQGFLPNEGGLLDQPLKYLQAMEVIHAAMNEMHIEEMRKNANK